MGRADILVIGQGFAGTAVAWALEAAGLAFEIADAGHVHSASAIAAGMLNPITGRRLVKSWRVDDLLPVALATYRAMENRFEARFFRPVRIRRLFADDAERVTFAAKHRRNEFGGWVGAHDEAGFWIEAAARIEGAAFLQAARQYWRRRGNLREERVAPTEALGNCAVVIDCRGVAATRDPALRLVPWEYSKGELLAIRSERLEPTVVLNRRHWVAAIDTNQAWVGATHEAGVSDDAPSPLGRTILEAAARDLLQQPFEVTRHVAGVRVTLPDKRPVIGTHPQEPRLGLVNGLGAKGALWAPWLAQQWVDHLQSGAPFDPEANVARFVAD